MDLEQLVATHLAAENEHRLEDTLATLHEECLFEDRALGQVFHGRKGAGEYYTTWWSAFDVVVKGEKRHWTSEPVLIAETRYQGTHIGEFLGIPATGRPIDFSLAVIITFRDGLMAGERFYYDLATLLRQMGVNEIPKGIAGS